MRSLILAASFCLIATGALAVEPLGAGDFFLVAKLTSKNTVRDAQTEYGMGFVNANHSVVSFSTSGEDGTTYRMSFTPGNEISFDCGWLARKAPGDRLNVICKAGSTDKVRALLTGGQDRNSYLRLIGARLKGVQIDFGKALVTVTLPDPAKPPVSVTVAWCTSQSGCAG